MGAYDSDIHAWAMQQAALLRAGSWRELDLENIAEEIEGLGKSQRRELVNRLAVLLAHLLKWRVQPSLRGTSWQLTIREQRRRLQFHLDDNPSLRARLDEWIEQGFEIGCLMAQRETGVERQTLPARCPWTPDQIFDLEFYPE
jgi:hypothetical protein